MDGVDLNDDPVEAPLWVTILVMNQCDFELIKLTTKFLIISRN